MTLLCSWLRMGISQSQKDKSSSSEAVLSAAESQLFVLPTHYLPGQISPGEVQEQKSFVSLKEPTWFLWLTKDGSVMHRVSLFSWLLESSELEIFLYFARISWHVFLFNNNLFVCCLFVSINGSVLLELHFLCNLPNFFLSRWTMNK